MFYDEKLNVIHTLKQFENQNVYFDPLTGNNGDELISTGARHAIDKCGCIRVNDLTQAKVIIVTGGAGLSSVWGGGYSQIERYFQYPYSDLPLIILPSTISIESFDLPKLFAERSAPSWIFCREKVTLERMRSGKWSSNVTIGLDHDMAFHLKGSNWLESEIDMCRDDYLLIVERRDAETLSGTRDKAVRVPRILKNYFPNNLKRVIKRRLHEKHRAETPFASWAQALANEHFSIEPDKPVKTIDVSLKGICSLDEFLSYIRNAEVIVTTRLHVAILSALLGKKTIIVPGDAKYGKIQGIYEYSMSEMPNVIITNNKFAN